MKRIAATGSSATTDVLIDRTRVWLTARLTDSANVRADLFAVFAGVLADLVEDHHGVVERVAEDRQEADDRVRRHLEAEDRVDAGHDDEVVRERDDRGDRHLPGAEVQRHDDDREHDERDERFDGRLGDVLHPRSHR